MADSAARTAFQGLLVGMHPVLCLKLNHVHMLTKTGSRPFARRRAALNRYFTANPNVQQQSKDITRYLLIGSCKTHTMSHSNVMEMQRSLVCTQSLYSKPSQIPS
ncbi:hypothetical protein NXS19_001935 [Fusarium pseudograminearum]|nr:hypothetical protein NXS19_001935 [Fusarium pseudograminearum]